jgi:hypothetical protein
MALTPSKDLTEFAQSAVALDGDFSELQRFSQQLSELTIESDHGLEQGRKILQKFSECGERIGQGIQVLARTLNESRERAEQAAQIVAERAAAIQARHDQNEHMLSRFQALGEMVKKITVAVGQFQKPAGGKFSDEEKALLTQHMPELNTQLGVLLDESKKLKDDAKEANLKSLEKNADSLNQSLTSVKNRLNNFVSKA